MPSPWLWAVFVVAAAGMQTVRNALQRQLTASLGTVGATHVRFLYGLPFGLLGLALILLTTGSRLPAVTPEVMAWTTLGGLTQIAATALMLAAMQERSFVVTIAYTKTEPVQVALFGLVVLGDQLTLPLAVAILIATAGVLIMSWPKRSQLEASGGWSWRPVWLGILSAGLFAMAAVGYRGAIKALVAPSFVVAASTVLALALALQTAVLTLYLLVRDRAGLIALFKAWRPSLVGGFCGAVASQFWFLAFALETAARVRTLGLVEILFAQLVSHNLFRQSLASREAAGILLVVAGVALLLML